MSTAIRQPAADRTPPHVHGGVTDDASALRVAKALAAGFAEGAGQRDRERIHPLEEFKLLASSGLLASVVPKAYGGAGISYATAARAVATIAGADASIAQLFVSTFVATRYVADVGTEEQKRKFFPLILGGARFGNASSELGGKTSRHMTTRAVPNADRYVITGRKFYTTSALMADYVSVVTLDENEETVTFVVDRHAPGLTVIDDWDGFGQRTTASGTIVLEAVDVPRDHGFYITRRPPGALKASAVPYLLHAAIDYGIGEAALEAAISFIRTKSRPYRYSGAEKASEDPLVVAALGELVATGNASELLLEHAGRRIDDALIEDDLDVSGRASLAVSDARIYSTRFALEASTQLFQLAGTSATRTSYGLDRYWRDARTHTTHDPVHWHAHVVGNYHLNEVYPPR